MALGKTSDELQNKAFAVNTFQKARGLLEAFETHVRDQDVPLAYFLIKMLTDRRSKISHRRPTMAVFFLQT